MNSIHAKSSPLVGLQEELQRQYQFLASDAPVRLVATSLAFLLCIAFLDWKIVLILGLMNLSCDIFSMRLMRRLDPVKQVWSYRLCLALGFLMAFTYALPPAMIWHLDSPYSKAFAVGMIGIGTMHVPAVRAIHLPVGLLALTAILGLSLVFNTSFWLQVNDYIGLFFSTVTIIGVVGYGLGALLQSHALHNEAAMDRAETHAANAAKSRFLAQVSHELRTPLNAILGLGHAELALNSAPESKARMKILVQSAENLTLVLDDILDMSAIQSGAVNIRNAPADPAAAITSLTELYRPMFIAKGLNLRVIMNKNLPQNASLDPQRLRQCLGNLLSNALKYTPQGGATIEVAYSADEMLRITVTDTGFGINLEERDLIFAAFHRGIGLEAGTGLGLAISRALARQMGGDLVLKPSAKGARFLLTLQAASLPAPASKAGVEHGLKLNLTGRQVLVVDDISSNRLVAGTYLRIMGAQVLEATSGEEALQVLQREAVDLVLLDMNMPGLSGVETLAKIRGIPGVAALPVVAMTADAAEAHRLAYLAAGLDGYVSKPMSPDSLAAAIAPHFAGGGTQG